MSATKAISLAPNEFAGTEGRYLLPHHVKEIERLRTQHALILSSTDQTLVTAPLKAGKVVVLDCGAADGTWLRELPRLYPGHQWEQHGVDIGSTLFPPEGDVNHLDLVEHDIRTPFPTHLGWQNKFDLIHQRLLIWGLQSAEWPTVIKNHKDTLKEGGWLQLVEGQWVDKDNIADPNRTPNLAKLSVLQRWSTSTFGMNIFVAYELEDLLKAAGFRNIEKKTFSLGYGAMAREPEWKHVSADLWVDTFRSLALKLPQDGIPGVAKDKDEFLAFLDALKQEVLDVGYAPQLNFVVGQK